MLREECVFLESDDFNLNKNYKAFFFRNEGNLKNKKQKQKNYFGVYRYLHLGV
jgi:hypothetical protein